MTQDEKHVVRQILREKGIPSESALMEDLFKNHAVLFRHAAAGNCGAMNAIRVSEGLQEYQATGE
jgi:hypothetical protein